MLTIHDKKGKVLLCQWLTYEYKYMMQELEDSCKVLLDCAYIGFDIKKATKEIERVFEISKKSYLKF